MNSHRLRRELRKELLLLQAEQHRQSLARELDALHQWRRWLEPLSAASGGGFWIEKASWLVSAVLPARWRKFFMAAMALRKLARLFGGKQQAR